MRYSSFSQSCMRGAAAAMILGAIGLAVRVKRTRDNPGRVRRQDEHKITRTFLEMANRHGDMDSLLGEFVAQIQVLILCAAVGIRLFDNEQRITRVSAVGFSQAFNRSACAGTIMPSDCACGRIARDQVHPEPPFGTMNGLYFVNSAGSFAAATRQHDQTLGCIACGYESVAIMPIRGNERIVGLIHLADSRPNMISAATARILEQVGQLIGTAIERVSAVEGLHQSEMTARALLDATTDSALLLEPDGTIVALNEPQARLWGRRKEELVGEKAFNLLDPELVSTLRRDWQAALTTGQPLHLGEISSDDKTYESQLFPVTAADGTVVRVAVYTRDITALKHAEVELRQAHDQLASLLALFKELASTLELKPLLELVLERLAKVVPYDAAAIFTVNGGSLEIAASRGYDEATERAEVKVVIDDISFIPRMVGTGSPFYVGDIQAHLGQTRDADTYLPPAMIPANARSWACAPLLVEQDLIGVLCLGHREPSFYDQRAVHLVQRAANKAAIAISNARHFQQAQDSAAADERTRLTQTMHDSVAQTLFSANLIARALSDSMTRNPEAAQRDLEKLLRLIQGASAQMRSLLLERHPAGLVEEQLGILFNHLSQTVSAQIGIPIALMVHGDCALPAEPQIALYLIAQEALNNIAKHAQASKAEIELTCHSTGARLIIRDNGRGFSPQLVPASHMGLGIMRARAEKIGATLEISSRIGHGTQILVSWNAYRN